VLSSTRFAINDWLNFPEDANSRVAVTRIKQGKSVDAAFDTRTRLQVVNDLREEGIRAYPDVFPAVLFQSNGQKVIRSLFTTGNDEFLPLASIANVTTVFCNESGEYIIYKSDEHGFHNPLGLWPAGRADIIALGDSYAHGACVPSDQGFVAVIRARYPATINLGVNGAGPLAMLATLKEYAANLKPRIVLWFYYEGNDLRDLDDREKYSPLLRNYLEPTFLQNLIGRQEEVDRVLMDYLEREMKSQANSFSGEHFIKLHNLRSAIHSVVNKRPGRDGMQIELIEHLQNAGAASTESDLELFRRILEEARKTVSSWGGIMYFVYLPTWERYRLPDLASKDREKVLSIVHELKIPLVDIHASFSKHADPLSLFPLRRYAHYNAEGHRLVGEEVLRQLQSESTLSRHKNGPSCLLSMSRQN
jgi:lysophospholipase L1-like esterase